MECCNKIKVRTEEEKKQLTTRINKIIGQMNGINKMIQDDRYCDDILIQLSAAEKAIRSVSNLLLSSHMHSCLIENIKNDNYEIIDEVLELFKRFQ